jgi:pullulanase
VPVAYSATTDETINYVSAHDGYCLWDAISAKAPFYTSGRNPGLASTFEKQRMQQLALGLTVFSQGIPFIEGGSEILRSKSGDVDSYDSGDWFNHLNFDYRDNNWGKGLPPSFKNYNDWSFWSPRLNDLHMKPSAEDISSNLKIFKAYLKIRNTSSLFGLKSLSQVSESLKYIDNEYSNTTGLIALNLKNSREELIILFNVNKNEVTFKHPQIAKGWKLHPELTDAVDQTLSEVSISNDEIVIPGRTIVVLVPNGKNIK